MNNSSLLMRRDIYTLLVMLIIVPLAGELKFYPFDQTFRVSLGSPVFFFFLLLLRKMPASIVGFLIGLSVEGFRILVDVIITGQTEWAPFFQSLYPAFFYYLTFGVLFDLLKVNRFENRPILLGLLGIFLEIISNTCELGAQMLTMNTHITISEMNKITIIAIFRSFFVIGFLNWMNLYEVRISEMKVRKQNERMLIIISNLYEESIHLKKTLVNAETITKKAYSLYKGLMQVDMDNVAREIAQFRGQALTIAGEVHDIKKDNQRIFAGLSKLISEESISNYMNINELVNIIVKSNEKYAQLLKKDVQFISEINDTHPNYHVYTILSVINNIIANAVEAFKEKGIIIISVTKVLDFVEFRIEDNGPGILPKHKELIFKPGFTSKYDLSGNPSTGIGLSYVKEIIEQLGGNVSFQNGLKGNGTIFTIQLPIHQLADKG